MSKDKYYKEILPSSKTKQSSMFFQKSNELINSELKNKDTRIVSNDGSTSRSQIGVVAERIGDRMSAMIQRVTVSNFNRSEFETQAKLEVLQDMQSKGITTIDEEVVEYAVEAKVRDYIKKNISNEFPIEKDDVIEMAEVGSNNLSYVMEKIVPQMKSDATRRVTERYVTPEYEKRSKHLDVPIMPTFGIDKSDEDGVDDEKFIIRVDPDLLVELIGVGKSSNSGFSTIFLVAKEKFDSTKTRALYDILARTIGIMNKYDRKVGEVSYEYLEILKIFGSNLYKQKKPNPKFNPETMHKDMEFLTDKKGNPLFVTDKQDNIIPKKDYKKTYNDFKKKVLQVALDEYSNKTDYKVEIVEIKKTKLGKLSMRGDIETIRFVITDNRPIKTNNFIATMCYFKTNDENNSLFKIKDFIKNKEATETKPLTRDIILGNLKTTEDLVELDLIENNKAYTEIKEIFDFNPPTLSSLFYDEEYGVIFDKSKPRDKNGLNARLGDNCVESLEKLKSLHSELTEDILNQNNKKDLSYFLPFDVVYKDNSIRINAKNFASNKSKIETTIKQNDKRKFKGFKSKFIKQEFMENYFPIEK